MRLRHAEESAGPDFLLEGRRCYLRQRDDVLYGSVVLGCERRRGLAIGIARHDLADHRLGLIDHGMRLLLCPGGFWPRMRRRASQREAWNGHGRTYATGTAAA